MAFILRWHRKHMTCPNIGFFKCVFTGQNRVWCLILPINLIGLRDVQVVIKHYLWLWLSGWPKKRLAFESVHGVSYSHQHGWIPSNPLRTWIVKNDRERVNLFPYLSCSIHLLLFKLKLNYTMGFPNSPVCKSQFQCGTSWPI